MLTRVAKPDHLGIRFLGRPMVRPQHVEKCKGSCFDIGAIVDVWWHGGWWEGIVLRQGDNGRLQVYFPGNVSQWLWHSLFRINISSTTLAY